jgi:hypothetical protein
MLAAFCALERPYFDVSVHIFTSQNDPVLTEIWALSPPGTRTQSSLRLENVVLNVGGLLHVGKVLFRCISTYICLPKWQGTHRDQLTLL